MTFDSFIQRLADAVDRPDLLRASEVDELADDLTLDSFELFEILVVLQNWGVDAPEQLFDSITSIGELFRYVAARLEGVLPDGAA